MRKSSARFCRISIAVVIITHGAYTCAGSVPHYRSNTQRHKVLTIGNAFADFLLGEPTGTPGILEGGIKTFQQDSTQRNYYARYRTAEPYFQDDWRVNSRLTLNLGLRMSLYGNWHEANNNVYNWVPSAYNPGLAAQATVDPFSGVLLNGPASVCDVDAHRPRTMQFGVKFNF